MLLSSVTAANEIEDLHQADKAEAQKEPKKAADGANKLNLWNLLFRQVPPHIRIPDVDIHFGHVQFGIPVKMPLFLFVRKF